MQLNIRAGYLSDGKTPLYQYAHRYFVVCDGIHYYPIGEKYRRVGGRLNCAHGKEFGVDCCPDGRVYLCQKIEEVLPALENEPAKILTGGDFAGAISLINEIVLKSRAQERRVSDITGQMHRQFRELDDTRAKEAALRSRAIDAEEKIAKLKRKLAESKMVAENAVMAVGRLRRQLESACAECSICLEDRGRVAFQCGHSTCAVCAKELKECPFCRATIILSIRLY
jgi:hypothetical protein